MLCNFHLNGLPEPEETILMVGIDSLHSEMGDLNRTLYAIAGVHLQELEQNAGANTAFDFKGRLAGINLQTLL